MITPELILLFLLLSAYVFVSIVGAIILWVIVGMKRRDGLSPWVFVPVWTFVLPGLWIMISLALVRAGPTQRSQQIDVRMEPKSAEYSSVVISEISSPYKQDGKIFSELNVEGHIPAGRRYEDVDPVTMMYVTYHSAGPMARTQTYSRRLDREVVLRGLKEVGADITRQDVVDEADEIIAIIKYIPNYGILNLSPRHFTLDTSADRGSDVPAKWFLVLLLGLLPVVWLAGLILFFRIRRKNLSTQPPSPGPAPPAQSAD